MGFSLNNVRKYLRPQDTPRFGSPEYKRGLSVPGINIRYGSVLSRFKDLPVFSRYIVGCLFESRISARSIRNNPYIGKTRMNPEEFKELEHLCSRLGIATIGYTHLETSHLFKDSVALFPYAIVFTMEMEAVSIQAAPSRKTIREIFRTYHGLGRAMNILAQFLRERGFNAQAIPAISNNLNLTVLGRDAGLGEFGAHGMLITPKYGPSVRLAAVLTDIENLPLHQDPAHTWILDYCTSCQACVRACPAHAIYETPKRFADGSEEHIDYRLCAVPFSRQHGCTVCIKECTIFKLGYERVFDAYLRRSKRG